MTVVGDRLELAGSPVFAGHLSLATGQAAGAQLVAARRARASLGSGSSGHLAREVAALDRVQAAFEPGAEQLQGHSPEDLTPELRDSVRARRQPYAGFSAMT